LSCRIIDETIKQPIATAQSAPKDKIRDSREFYVGLMMNAAPKDHAKASQKRLKNQTKSNTLSEAKQ